MRQKHRSDLLREVSVLRGVDNWDTSRIRQIDTQMSSHVCVFLHAGDVITVKGGSTIKVFDAVTGEYKFKLRGKDNDKPRREGREAESQPHNATNLKEFSNDADHEHDTGLVFSENDTLDPGLRRPDQDLPCPSAQKVRRNRTLNCRY